MIYYYCIIRYVENRFQIKEKGGKMTTDFIFLKVGFLLATVSTANLKFQFLSDCGYKLIGIVGAIWFVLMLVPHIF